MCRESILKKTNRIGYFVLFKWSLYYIRFSFLFFIQDIFSKVAPSRFKVYQATIEDFFYGYPLVLMDRIRQIMTATNKVEPPYAPINQFAHMQRLPDFTTKDIIVCPNVDTLYSIAWLELSREPMILSLPAVPDDRYYLFPLLDAWTNVFESLGTRTTGNQPGVFVIIGPNWRGELPNDFKKIHAPTNMVWILGRILVYGPNDYHNVVNIQNKIILTPLSKWQKNDVSQAVFISQTINKKTLPTEQVNLMDAKEFFTRLCLVIKDNPPSLIDKNQLKKLSVIGIQEGKLLDNTINSKTNFAFNHGFDDAKKMTDSIKYIYLPHRLLNGWQKIPIGKYDSRYLIRALVAEMGLGANLPEDAIYFRTFLDHKRQSLDGQHQYVLHFPANGLPPVKGFWSLTVYNLDHYLIQNSIQRYALGDRDKMKFNADGSLDIFIQHLAPAQDKISNWLPSPLDEFILILRLYWPEEALLQGQWLPPPVKEYTSTSAL